MRSANQIHRLPTVSRRVILRRGFTLTEVLIVLGLIIVLISLFLPVLTRARAAARQAACLSNLRQMGLAWTIYLNENKGRLPDYAWNIPATPDGNGWDDYWPGILQTYKVRGQALLCPAANEPIPYAQLNKGFGNVNYAWTGAFSSAGTVGRLNEGLAQISSYGYNRYLTAAGGFARDTAATRITAARGITRIPVFFDCTAVDARPVNGSEIKPVEIPPNLRGDGFALGAPEHWRFLIARHGRGVNVFFADGSARWNPLEQMYMLAWRSDWVSYPLTLPLY